MLGGLQAPLTWPAAVFLVLFAIYLDHSVDMRLVFWNQNDLFLWNLRYAREFLVAPGQPSAWLGKLLLQACYHGWPGALAVAMLVGVLFAAARASCAQFASRASLKSTWMAPAVLLLVLHSGYSYSPASTIGLAFAMTATWVYLRTAGGSDGTRLAAFAAVSGFLYYLAGPVHYVFAACGLVYELLVAKRRLLGLTMLPAAVAIQVGIGSALGHLNAAFWHVEVPGISYLIYRPPSVWLVAALDAYYPVCMLFLAAGPRLRAAFQRREPAAADAANGRFEAELPGTNHAQTSARWGDAEAPADRPRQPRRPRKPRSPRPWAAGRRTVPYLLLVAASVGGIKMLVPATTKSLLEVDWSSNQRAWGQVLRAAAGLPDELYADYANQDVNLALQQLGRLPYDMFAYRQRQLFVDHGFGSRGRMFSRKACDLFLELGRVNEAETIAHNDWEAHPSAEFLLRMALTKLIKGRPNAARVYLNALREDWTYGARAESLLERLRENRTLEEPDILRVRSRLIIQDDAQRTQVRLPDGEWSVSAERTLDSLLERNPQNRVAFEYLMAIHLLQKNLRAVVENLPRLHAYSYPETPLLYEEAALLYARDDRQALQLTAAGALISGCPVSARSVDRFRRLVDIGNEHRGFAHPAARQAVLRDLGPTYFYFFLYGGD